MLPIGGRIYKGVATFPRADCSQKSPQPSEPLSLKLAQGSDTWAANELIGGYFQKAWKPDFCGHGSDAPDGRKMTFSTQGKVTVCRGDNPLMPAYAELRENFDGSKIATDVNIKNRRWQGAQVIQKPDGSYNGFRLGFESQRYTVTPMDNASSRLFMQELAQRVNP